MKGCVDDLIPPDIMIREINCDHVTVLQQQLEKCIPQTSSLLVTVADKDGHDLARNEISIDKLIEGGHYLLKTWGGNHRRCALSLLRSEGMAHREDFKHFPMQVYDGKSLSISQKIKLSALHNLSEEKKLRMAFEDVSKLFRRQLYEVYGYSEDQETPLVPRLGRQADMWRVVIAESVGYKVTYY